MTASTRTLVRGGATGVAALSVAIGLLAAPPTPEPDTPLAVVLVSGRDDHGVEVTDTLPLHASPDGPVTGRLDADTLVQVHEEQPPWLLVTSLEGDRRTGWVDDFVLRGTLHTVVPETPACPVPTAEGELPASAQVRVVDLHTTPTGTQVGVIPVAGGSEHHLPRAWVRELPGPRPSADGADCADVPDVPLAPAHRH